MGRWAVVWPSLVTFADVAVATPCSIPDAAWALSFATGARAKSARVTGVDPSAGYVREAQARAPADRMRFLVGDAQALEFPDASFDKALSLVVMNFVRDPARALEEMTRVTRPAGIVTAAVWDYGQGMEMLRSFWDEAVALDGACASRDERNMPLCRPGELETLWRAGGLERVEEQPIEIEMPFVSFDDYGRRADGAAGAHAEGLTDGARSALQARLRVRLLGGRTTARSHYGLARGRSAVSSPGDRLRLRDQTAGVSLSTAWGRICDSFWEAPAPTARFSDSCCSNPGPAFLQIFREIRWVGSHRLDRRPRRSSEFADSDALAAVLFDDAADDRHHAAPTMPPANRRTVPCDSPDYNLTSARSTVVLPLTVNIFPFGLYDSAASTMIFSGFTPAIL
jgi:hypothetical protein